MKPGQASILRAGKDLKLHRVVWAPETNGAALTTTELREVASDIYSESGDGEAGVRAFVEKIQGTSLATVALRLACSWLLMEQRRKLRQRISGGSPQAPTASSPTDEDVDVVLLNPPRAGDWPLESGRRLRDSTFAEVRHQAERHETMARGNVRSAKFMRFILAEQKRLEAEDSAAVHTVLSDDTLDDLMGRAIPGGGR